MKKRILKALSKISIALLFLWVALNIPSYFKSVDSSVLEVFEDSQDKEDLVALYISTAKPAAASLVLESSKIRPDKKTSYELKIAQMLEAKPIWKLTGSKNAFFDEYASLVPAKDIKEQSAYEYFSSASNRNAFLGALSESDLPLVGDILKLRNLNTTLLPPAFSTAGAPYSASLIITAILVQNSSLSSGMLQDISTKTQLVASDSAKRVEFEEYCMGLLFFAKNMSFGELTEVVSKANKLEDVSLLARAFAYNKVEGASFEALSSAFLLYPNVEQTLSYLESRENDSYIAYIEASNYNQEAMKKLLGEGLTIYKESSFVEYVPLPFKGAFASLSAYYTGFALFLKLLLLFVGCFIVATTSFWRSDTPKWYSPLALVRGVLWAIVLSSLICLALEPSIFTFSSPEENTPEIKLAISSLNNLIEENDIIKFDMDTATILTLSLFLLMQFVIFASCLIKITSIKRMAVSPSVKLELLSNEDNLFDLGLYVGLGGTVLSLIMLSVSMMNTALMAGYSSTLFGIMFTALLKIAFVRPYRHSLLLEVARGK